jgi:transmembrane sensor
VTGPTITGPGIKVSDDAREAAADWCLRYSDEPQGIEHNQAFQEWLASDPDHPELFERTMAAWTAVEQHGSHSEFLRLRSASRDNFEAARRRQRRRPGVQWRQIFAIAACLIVVLAAGTWWRYTPTSYETGTGERQVVTLADGSSISLDAATRVEVRYFGDRRELWLDHGRAKFTVAKDPLRPFSVQAGNRMIVATGTQFSVEKIASEVRVVLYEGRVAVMDTSQAKPRPLAIGPKRATAEQILVPGTSLIVPDRVDTRPLPAQGVVPESAPITPRIVAIDSGRSLGWEGGLLEFSNEPLGSAVERMNRYGTQTLRVAKGASGSTMISGQFEGRNTEAFVEGVTSVFPLVAVPQSDGTIELRAKKP